MKTIKVLDKNMFPASLPIFTVIALDYWNAPKWLWVVVGLLFVTVWIVAIILILQQFIENEDEVSH